MPPFVVFHCHCCQEHGHATRECVNPARTTYFNCCGWWGHHRFNYAAAHLGRPSPEVEPSTKRTCVEGGMKAPSPDPHLARTPGQLEKFPESFIEEMDDILIQPEWFNAWEGYFKRGAAGRRGV
jgi:hypothetical protein